MSKLKDIHHRTIVMDEHKNSWKLWICTHREAKKNPLQGRLERASGRSSESRL